MVVSKIYGGLGNQMFQYAVGRTLSILNGVDLFLDISEFNNYKVHGYGLNNYNISAKIYEKPRRMMSAFKWLPYRSSIKKYKELSLAYDPNVLKLGDNVYLDGYWQTSKYFECVKNVIENDFECIIPPNYNNNEWISKIQSNNSSVSLHIRRGDYLTNPAANKVHGLCPLDYYKSALNRIVDLGVVDPVFYVFSDDIKWAKQNLRSLAENINFIDCNRQDHNFDDLRLMSACRHNIIANSTFSWWAAWLNKNENKIVIAPKMWFMEPKLSNPDLIPDSWFEV